MKLPDFLTSRREFFKSFPQFFLNELRSVTNEFAQSSKSKENKPKIARIDVSRCLAWAGLNCQLCYVACPHRDRAIEIKDLRPMIIPLICDGCGMCEIACRTVNDTPAVWMVDLRTTEDKIL
ncbi:MAG: hypothetical protein HYS07_03850 [Chlamydiae bacterium]|nr:hypothetical protein [Chlamydiota bacterium]